MTTSGVRQARMWWVTVAVGLVALLVNIPWFNALFVSFRTDGDISRGATAIGAPTLSHYANALGAAGYDFPSVRLRSSC